MTGAIIRARRKDCRNPQPGQTLYLYTGMRTKGCRKLKESICLSVEQLSIEENNGICHIVVGVKCLSVRETMGLILADGFNNPINFWQFFQETHGLPFYGLLIKW